MNLPPVVPPSTQSPNDTEGATSAMPRTVTPRGPDDAIISTHEQITLDNNHGQDDSSTDRLNKLADDLKAGFGDRFVLGKHLGQGGFGAVFEAVDRRLNRRVAIKSTRIRSTDKDLLLREARALAQLRHPGIVGVYDVAVAGSHCFVVSELLPGPSLAKWIFENPPTPLEAARVIAEVADALAHAHARSIIHRDLKPSNVVFADGRRPVLVDFGLALWDQDTARERGAVSGTPAYMSPEQAGGRAHQPDGRIDVYGLAATLYALLCGRPPFRGSNGPEILRQVREDDPLSPRQLRPDIPRALEAACLKGLSKLPGDRFTTVSDFAEAVRQAVGLLPYLPQPSESLLPVRASSSPQSLVAPPTPCRGPRSERRQLTLLQLTFDAARGDDDDPMEEVAVFQAICAELVATHRGLVLQHGGTGFLACFGYPVAHEDAPRQAVRAAFGVCGRAARTHAAIGTGQVVITENAGSPIVVVGDVTASVAMAATQGEAGAVIVTEGTFRLIEGFFVTESLGEIWPRGAPESFRLYRVMSERDARSRVDAADPARLAPLVGRDREVSLLKERWELTAEGVRNVLLLVADPGVGKSRLVRILRDHAIGQAGSTDLTPLASNPESTESGQAGSGQFGKSAACIEWYCSPYHQSSPFYPVTDYFDRAYQLTRDQDAGRRLDRLIARLRDDGVHDSEDQALFAAMLSIAGGERLPKLELSPDRQRERTVEAVLAWLAAKTERTPILFVVEDLHWIDPSSESLLARFVEDGGEVRVLGVLTFRPEYDPPWKGKSIQTQVALNRLTRSQVGELVRAQAGADVAAEIVEQIADRTDGVPLFIEEFTRLVVESGKESGINSTIPASLQDLLLARLDRMASDRQVVQLGATIGRTFAYDLLRASSDRDESTLQAELGKLISAGLLFPKGSPPRCTYTFKHALIQDAAYQSLVKKQRQAFHRAVATALNEQFPGVGEKQPELLAHHFAEAGENRIAIDHWLAAGSLAAARYANAEAIKHYRRGLASVASLPPGADRDQLELQFQVPLATVITVARGWAAPEAEAVHLRAAELCRQIGPSAPLFHITWGQWAWRVLRAELDTADALAHELWNQAKQADPSYVVEACFAHVCTGLFRGEVARAIEFGRLALELFDQDRSVWHAKFTGQNAGSTIRSHYAWALWIAGYPAAAIAVAEAGVELGRSLKDQFSEAFALYHLGCVQQHIRRAEETRVSAEAAIAIGLEKGYGIWTALGSLCRGSALVLGGREISAGLEQIRQAIENYRATGAILSLSHYYGALGEAYRATGQFEQAAAAIESGLKHAAATHERFHESNLLRLRGDLLLAASPENSGHAEAEYRRAIEIARSQGALSWELRAAISLARLSRGGQPLPDAATILADVTERFPQAFDTPDLEDARTLIDALT